MRTHYCGDLNTSHIGNTVTLCGWVHRRRDHGGVIFIDLRDRQGIAQIVVDTHTPSVFSLAESIRNEYVLCVTCLVRARPLDAVNLSLASGEVEMVVSDLSILNPSITPPFVLDDEKSD